MRQAIELARKGEGRTSPNPPVGALVIKNRTVVGRGYHKKAGGPHAEVEALKRAGQKARGATLVVTLEPCSHFGRTPPCVDAIIDFGVNTVLVGARDPTPQVSGRGTRRLRSSGIEVEAGILKEECSGLIAPFAKYIRTGLPYVFLKTATSLDGKIATATGESQWITGPKARDFVHQLRNKVDAILVGAGTAVKDDPRLSARIKGRQERFPVRVLIDPNHRVSSKAQLFQRAADHPVIVVTRAGKKPGKVKTLERKGVEFVTLPAKQGRIDFKDILQFLGERGIVSLLIEGGGEVNAHALNDGVVDRVYWFLAPLLIGGQRAPGPVGGSGISKLKDAWKLKKTELHTFGQDLMIEGIF